MKQWVESVPVAVAVFVLLAGAGAIVLPPDVVSALPVSVAALVVCWPIGYWFTYRRSKCPPS